MTPEIFSLKERAIESLKGIFDPEIPVNIYDLGLIYSLEVDEEEKTIKVQMTLTTPACPVAQTFPQTIQDTLLGLQNVSNVSVELVWDPPWTQERMSEVAKLQLNLF